MPGYSWSKWFYCKESIVQIIIDRPDNFAPISVIVYGEDEDTGPEFQFEHTITPTFYLPEAWFTVFKRLLYRDIDKILEELIGEKISDGLFRTMRDAMYNAVLSITEDMLNYTSEEVKQLETELLLEETSQL